MAGRRAWRDVWLYVLVSVHRRFAFFFRVQAKKVVPRVVKHFERVNKSAYVGEKSAIHLVVVGGYFPDEVKKRVRKELQKKFSANGNVRVLLGSRNGNAITIIN